MKITYETDEALEILQEMFGERLQGYIVKSISFDKWSGLEIRAEKINAVEVPDRPASPPPQPSYPDSDVDVI